MTAQHTRAGVALGAIIAVALAIGVVAARGDPAGNAATEWNVTAVDTLVNLPGPAGGAPPASQVNVGMTQGAVFDAVNAIDRRYKPYLLTRRFPATASKDAAVATAAYTVLAHIVATVPASISFPGRNAVLQSLASRYAASLAAIPTSSAKTQGIAAGTAAAAAMIDARQGDGRFGPSQWVPNRAPGHWQPLSTPTGQPILDPTPWVGGVRPFLLQSSSQFRTPGPNGLSTAAWAKDFNEVKLLGSANSAVRTGTQTYIARWWQSNPVASWNAVASDLVAGYGLDLADTARLLAMENLSGADAAINCWNDKYFWDFWRAWNAIPRAIEDGNPATDPEPWSALITAPYPEHPSGHICLDAAHTRVLQMVFGTDAPPGGFQITSASTLLDPADARTRSFSSFSQAIAELIEARIWAGLHYRAADVQAYDLGRNVADYMAANSFQRLGVFGGR
jgi:hypothetical protein